MVDVVTNRMFDTFSRFNPRDNHQTDSLSSISTLKRFSKDQKFRRQLTRETDQKVDTMVGHSYIRIHKKCNDHTMNWIIS